MDILSKVLIFLQGWSLPQNSKLKFKQKQHQNRKIPQNADFLWDNFYTLYLEERTEDKAPITCSVYTTMASGQETVGVITGRLVEVHHCSWRMPRLRTLKAAHWKLRGLRYSKLLRASENEANKQMLRNYHDTTKDKSRCREMSVAGVFVVRWSEDQTITQVIVNWSTKWDNQRSESVQNCPLLQCWTAKLWVAVMGQGGGERGRREKRRITQDVPGHSYALLKKPRRDCDVQLSFENYHTQPLVVWRFSPTYQGSRIYFF